MYETKSNYVLRVFSHGFVVIHTVTLYMIGVVQHVHARHVLSGFDMGILDVEVGGFQSWGLGPPKKVQDKSAELQVEGSWRRHNGAVALKSHIRKVCMFSRYSGFLPQSVSVNMSVNGRLSLVTRVWPVSRLMSTGICYGSHHWPTEDNWYR